MSTIAASPRAIAWQRRRRALAQAWALYRRHLPGMIGLGILVAIFRKRSSASVDDVNLLKG